MQSIRFVFSIILGLAMAQEEAPVPDCYVFMKQFLVHVQIREPSGIMVWTRNSPLIEMFGVELHVGRQNPNKHHEFIWDRHLLANASIITDGKFLIQDSELVVHQGETIRYRYSVLHKKTLSHSNFHRVLVTDHLFYRPKSNDCYSQCLVAEQKELHMEAARLKDILERKIEQCVGLHASEHLLFPLENADSIVADPLLFVQHRLWQIEGLRPLVDNVVTVYLAHNGVGFRMRTLIDKLKVLELGKDHLKVIDFLSPDTDSTEEETVG